MSDDTGLRFLEATDEDMEEIAAYVHEQWSGWMRHIFKRGYWLQTGQFLIDAEHAARWLRQTEAKYSELSDDERDLDRIEARGFVRLFSRLLNN